MGVWDLRAGCDASALMPLLSYLICVTALNFMWSKVMSGILLLVHAVSLTVKFGLFKRGSIRRYWLALPRNGTYNITRSYLSTSTYSVLPVVLSSASSTYPPLSLPVNYLSMTQNPEKFRAIPFKSTLRWMTLTNKSPTDLKRNTCVVWHTPRWDTNLNDNNYLKRLPQVISRFIRSCSDTCHQ
jgi:hypothetical protein